MPRQFYRVQCGIAIPLLVRRRPVHVGRGGRVALQVLPAVFERIVPEPHVAAVLQAHVTRTNGAIILEFKHDLTGAIVN